MGGKYSVTTEDYGALYVRQLPAAELCSSSPSLPHHHHYHQAPGMLKLCEHGASYARDSGKLWESSDWTPVLAVQSQTQFKVSEADRAPLVHDSLFTAVVVSSLRPPLPHSALHA